MNYIILDLEWNQSPYGKSRENPLMPFEIIEIGAVRMDPDAPDTEEALTFHEIIRPQLYRKLHYMTRTVVAIRESDFVGARTFPEVFRDFIRWCGDDPIFCTWGPGDLTELQRNMRYHGIENPFPYPFFYRDLQKVFAIVYEERHTRRSLEWAVEYLGIPKREQFHDAFSDALYTAQILPHLPQEAVQKNTSIDLFRAPRTREEEIRVTYGSYSKYISRPFSERSRLMQDKAVIATECWVCGAKAPRVIRWFSDGGRNFLCAARCPEHGLLRGKIRVRTNAGGEWYAVKTIRSAGAEEVEQLREHQEALRERRRDHRHAAREHDHEEPTGTADVRDTAPASKRRRRRRPRRRHRETAAGAASLQGRIDTAAGHGSTGAAN